MHDMERLNGFGGFIFCGNRIRKILIGNNLNGIKLEKSDEFYGILH